MEQPFGIFFIIAGLFSAVCAVLDWDFFINHHKARFMIKFLGRKGARILYIVLGTLLVVLGVLFIFGVIGTE